MIGREKIAEILKSAAIDVDIKPEDYDRPFSDIGIDSLDVFSFLSEIEIQFGVSFSEEEFSNMKTLTDVIKKLND